MTSAFTKQLYKGTKSHHTIVDKHPFVQVITTDSNAAKLYIEFNKICIEQIQTTFREMFKDHQMNNFSPLLLKLQRNIDRNDINISISTNLKVLLDRCKSHPLEHAYMFYLGLMMGYKILQKYVQDDILSYENSKIKDLITEFKKFLDDTVCEQEEFIKVVCESYDCIKLVFDEYYSVYQNTLDLNN